MREFKSSINIYRHDQSIFQLTMRYNIYYLALAETETSSIVIHNPTNNRKSQARESKQKNQEIFLKGYENKKGVLHDPSAGIQPDFRNWKKPGAGKPESMDTGSGFWVAGSCFFLNDRLIFFLLVHLLFLAIHSIWLKVDVSELYGCYIPYSEELI